MFDSNVGLFFFLILFLLIFGTIFTLFWLWMLIDCALNEPPQGNDKLVWVIIIVLTSVFGALLYFFIRRPKRRKEYGK